jgi:acyl transferase domain-containing protein/NAD(P)-dependent dehydrogenase (short-subunit alcohol dehydrogenase family)
VAGVIKMVMAMRHGRLPRTLHVDRPSRNVDWSTGAVSLLTHDVAWVSNGRARRAGVSSFGISGTNSHVILEEAPLAGTRREASPEGQDVEPIIGAEAGFEPLILSAHGRGALLAQAGRLARHLESRPVALGDVALSLLDRAAFEDRAVLVGGDPVEGLRRFAAGNTAPGLISGRISPGANRPVFVFPGQGGQWSGMAVGLLEESPVFAGLLAECEEALSGFVDWSLEGVLRGAEGVPGLDRVDVVQPALFAVMVSLAGLWRACGVEPVAVVGHSQGEIAAAVVAGGLSLKDGAQIVTARSRVLAGALSGRGGMASVAQGVDGVQARIGGFEGRVSIAAVNGPSSVVVSGEVELLERLVGACEADGVRARVIPVDYAAHSQQIELVRDELLEGCEGITPRSASVPFFSAVTGGRLDTASLDGEYWYRNLRETVQFEQATGSLLEDGHRVFIETSPHPVLNVGLEEIGEELDVLVSGSLRREEGGIERFLLSLGKLWVGGVDVDWRRVLAGGGRERIGLPTYAFQRERFWLSSATGVGDVRSAGLRSPEHPLLGAVVGLAGSEELVLTGRISMSEHPWLADHAVMGTVLYPGTGLLELALRAGEIARAPMVRELVLQAPLILAEGAASLMQVIVGAPEDDDARSVSIYSRLEAQDPEEQEWILHAEGTLAGGLEQEQSYEGLHGEWPPTNAEPVELDGVYESLAEAGLEYGPVFQGLQKAWRHENAIYAEAALLPDESSDTFTIHPALLDAALHTATLIGAGGAEVRLPFSWQNVRLEAVGATGLRLKLSVDPEGIISLAMTDWAGVPVLSTTALATRPVAAEQLQQDQAGVGLPMSVTWLALGRPRELPQQRAWTIVAGEDSGLASALRACSSDVRVCGELMELTKIEHVPETVVLDVSSVAGTIDGGVVEGVRECVDGVLLFLQGWLGDERFIGSRLIVVSQGVVGDDGGLDGLVGSGVWGLVRSAQSENPGRIVLVDWDGGNGLLEGLGAAVGGDEPQLAVDGGEVLAARLSRVREDIEEESEGIGGGLGGLDGRSVLVTGGTGGLGALVARHLVEACGVEGLILASRRGLGAPGATRLRDELVGLGARVDVVACDVSDREALRGVIENVEGGLGGVVHAAGVLEDGLVSSLTVESVGRVFAPKVDAGWFLHELTEGLDLSVFVLFSSAAGCLGSPGQGNYAAANAFLDGLASYRQARGLPATSIAWGFWDRASDMTDALSEADVARMARQGVLALSVDEGLGYLDRALAPGQAAVVAMNLDMDVLRSQARAGSLPVLMSGLVRVPVRRAGEMGSLARRLTGLAAEDRERVVVELVRSEVATLLGYLTPEEVPVDRAFKDLGFDSLAAVELRNTLNRITGLRLSPTLVFDHPTATAITQHILEQASYGAPAAASLEEEVDRLEKLLSTADADRGMRMRLASRLQGLVAALDEDDDQASVSDGEDLRMASEEELLNLIDEELVEAAE